MKKMLDLFSGLKGASQAFIESDEWEVVTVDINSEMEPDHVLDLTDPLDFLSLYPPGHFELIWASPPCVEFYRVLAPWYPEYGDPPDMGLVNSAVTIVREMNPKTWVLENTESGHRFIENVLGPFRQKIGPFYLWGNAPLLANVHVSPSHKADVDVWSDNPLRSAIKSKVPLAVSEGLLRTLEQQSTLF
jgi:hypothetical protein